MTRRRIKCRPLRMPELFAWGGTNPQWDDAVDEYLEVRAHNRLCDFVNRRAARRDRDEMR